MEVRETKRFAKQIAKAAPEIKAKYFTWYKSIEKEGYDVVKSQNTWRDHPLYGGYEGQRAIKLGGKWRAIYKIEDGEIHFIEMQELTPHGAPRSARKSVSENLTHVTTSHRRGSEQCSSMRQQIN